MTTPRPELFAVAAIVVTLALIVLSRATARVVADDDGQQPEVERCDLDLGADEPDAADETPADRPPAGGPVPSQRRLPTGGALLANVALTHGLLGVFVLALAWYSALPWAALGLGPASVSATAVGLGVALGVGLYAASETAGAVAERAGIEYDERLRELLAPRGPGEWALMMLVVLPIVAGGEELLFRGALIGALGFGLDLPLPALVVGSSVLFGAGHSAQGAVGVGATMAMGLVLGTAFVLTGSLVVVIVAHYAVNALEFVVEEGLRG